MHSSIARALHRLQIVAIATLLLAGTAHIVHMAAYAQDAPPATEQVAPVPVQTPVPTPASWQDLLPLVITIVVPVLVWATKNWIIPRVPKWLLPLLTPLLGVALSWLAGAMGGDVSWWQGAVYGGLATWLREFVDQIKKAPAAGISP